MGRGAQRFGVFARAARVYQIDIGITKIKLAAGPKRWPVRDVDFDTFLHVAKKGFFLALFSLKMVNFLSLF